MQPLADFVSQNHGLSLAEFEEKHPYPFLLLETAEAEPVPDTGFQTMSGGAHPAPVAGGIPQPAGDATVIHDAGGETGPVTVRDRILPVVKGSGTPFPGMITVGRAGNNDVVLRFQHISKFHAYFTKEADGTYSLTEGGSTNGTSVNQKALEEGTKVTLQDGDVVNFGGDLPLTFFQADSLHRYLPVLARRLAEEMRKR